MADSKLPSTKALQVFTCVAESMSVTQAAGLLFMTQSAVSRQIQSLESLLGVELFRREKQRLYLTSAGQQYLHEVGPILDQLKQATLRIEQGAARSLSIGIEPALASRWLIPRLPAFKSRFPGLDIELMTDIQKLYQQSAELDVCFLFGDGQFAAAQSYFFMAERLVAVCTPDLLKTQAVAKTIAQSLSFPMLHHTAAYSASEAWMQAAGLTVAEIESRPGSRLGSFGLMIDLAKQGLGMAVVPEYFVAADLADGSLVQACEEYLASDHAYYLVVPDHRSSSQRIERFCEWVLQA